MRSALPLSAIREFLRMEAAGGIVLAAAALAGLILANSSWSGAYTGFLDLPLSIETGAFKISKPLLLGINDGLMAVFFLIVGLEIKREILDGELSSLERASLPAIAAIGGMIVPGRALSGLHLERSYGHERLGHSRGNRYRLCPRGPGPGGTARAGVVAHIPPRSGHPG